VVAGQERVVWSAAISIPPKEIAFKDVEIIRIRVGTNMWDSFGVNADRRWLEPVATALFGDAPGVHA
jgi:hypothetical protein